MRSLDELRKPSLMVFDWDHTLVASPTLPSQEEVNCTIEYYKQKMTLDMVRSFDREELNFSLPIIMSESEDEPCMDWFKLPFSETVLEYFSNKNVKTAVVSNKDRVILHLEVDLLKWRDYFDVVIGRGDAPRMKPAPDLLELAKARCGISSDSEVWFIGDSRIDTQAAHAANCTAIHYRYDVLHGDENYRSAMRRYESIHPVGDGEAGASYSLDSMKDLIDFFESAK